MLNVLSLIDRLHMTLWIAGCTNAEITTLPDLADQLGCIAVVILDIPILWDIPTQRHDILNVIFF